MSASTSEPRVVRFGVFELDLELRELRKAGLGLNLQEQPLQILECLLERPGRLVSRDELRKRLWPSDTLVDFEHGLNAAVKRLRDTLGDSADTPRFIETVPRRGYRFIARVGPSGEAGIGHPSQTSTGPAQQNPAAPGAAASQRSPRGRSWILWSLTIDGNRGRVRGGIQPLTEGLQYDRCPSVSVNGDALCFARYGFKGHAIYVMNARGGPETLRVPTSADVGLPVISADGSRIAYPRHAGEKGSIEVVRTSGGEAERVSSDCGLCVVEGWSHDNAHLSYIDGSNGRTEVSVLDLETGLKRVLATRSGHSLFQSRFSPDDRWLSFVDVVGNHSRVWIAPTPEGNRTADPATWIAVTTDDSWNDKPRWSPDGSIMYFISDRDGFRCVWAQRLDHRTRHPIDQPFAVYHIHSARRSMMNLLAAYLGLDCADDRLVFNMGEDTGNIWTTRLEGAP